MLDEAESSLRVSRPMLSSTRDDRGRQMSGTQTIVLAALCRPYENGRRFATPATNREIAAELFMSIDAVKSCLRVLCRKLDVDDELRHNRKRARLVERAFELGLVGADSPSAPQKVHP